MKHYFLVLCGLIVTMPLVGMQQKSMKPLIVFGTAYAATTVATFGGIIYSNEKNKPKMQNTGNLAQQKVQTAQVKTPAANKTT